MTDATNTELMAMTNPELVGIHNALADQLGTNTLKNWKRAKDLLVDRIEEMRAQVVQHPEPMFDEDDELTSVRVEDETFRALDEDETLEPAAGEPIPADDAEPEASDGAKSDRTIKAASVELLCHVAYYEDRDAKIDPENNVVEASNPKARSVGLAYDEIIRRIQDEFPGCSTTVACLRWYSVKIRVEEHGYEDLRLPQRRPRAKPRTAK